jgi:hypothetical protein
MMEMTGSPWKEAVRPGSGRQITERKRQLKLTLDPENGNGRGRAIKGHPNKSRRRTRLY